MSQAVRGIGRDASQLAREHPVVTACVAGAVVRLVAFAMFAAGASDPIALAYDGHEYWEAARHLSEELSFDDPRFLLRPPGYPGAIAAVLAITPGASEWVAIGVSLVASIATVPLTYALATSLGLEGRIATLAAFVMAVEPTSARFAVTPLADPLVTLLIVGAMTIALLGFRTSPLDFRKVALSCLLFALAALTKPVAVGAAAIFAGVLLFAFRQSLVPRLAAVALIVAAGSLLPSMAWTQSNERSFGVAEYSSIGNFNLYFYRAAGVLARVSDDRGGELEQRLADRLSREIGARPGSRSMSDYRYTTDPVAIAKMRDLAIDVFRDHPDWFSAMYPVGAVRLWFRPWHSLNIPAPLYIGFLLVLYGAAVIGLGRLWKTQRLAAVVILAMVAYLTLSTTTTISSTETRMFLPAFPLIAVAAGAGLARPPRWRGQYRARRGAEPA